MGPKTATKSAGTVEIHGKIYETIASRLQRFIKENPRYNLTSTVTEAPDLSSATVVCVIEVFNEKHETQRRVTGTAHERVGASSINKTSHIENAETSAVGRALAFLGYAGTEIASADEVAQAIKQQGDTPRPATRSAPKSQASAPSTVPGYRSIKAKYEGSKCGVCKVEIPVGMTVLWDKGKKIYHPACLDDKLNAEKQVDANAETVVPEEDLI